MRASQIRWRFGRIIRRLTTSRASRDGARARLRELLEPVREEVEEEFAEEGGADLLDAIRTYQIRPHLVQPEEEESYGLFRLVETAGWTNFTPLYYVFLEDEG